jgi:hypothetical protein
MPESSRELLEVLIPKNGTCVAIIGNGLPPDYGVTITAAACEFFYRGGGSFIDSATNLHLTSGLSTTLKSNDPTKCVSNVHCAETVQVEGEPNPRLIQGDVPAPAAKCVIQADFTLVPQRSISEEAHKTGDILQMITTRDAPLEVKPGPKK